MSETAEFWTPPVPTPSIKNSLRARLLPTVLSITAGSVDAISFLGLGGLFTAHVTGNLVILAAHLVSGSGAPVAPMLSGFVESIVTTIIPRNLRAVAEAAAEFKPHISGQPIKAP